LMTGLSNESSTIGIKKTALTIVKAVLSNS
jgi:hypothetical protein